MKCKTCNGLGRTKATEFIGVDEGLRDIVILCPTCGGKGEVEQTNEEWLHTLNTEQLAEKLTDFAFWLIPYLPTEDKREQVRKRIENWLKEKHDAK